jgi:PAS domain S-box-containing protein
VPVTPDLPPNPYLSEIPERDITTPSGRKLTLINPPYMFRQMSKMISEEYGGVSHFTSLRAIRPENGPDPWEIEALKALERGEAEVISVAEMEGEDSLRLMRSVFIEKSCLKCHASQGYKMGDIRGGISISIPMLTLRSIARKHMVTLSIGHSIIWSLGIGMIRLGTRRLNQHIRERDRTEEMLRASEERYRTLFEESRDAIYITTQKGNVLKLNKSALDLFGYTIDDAVRMDGREVFVSRDQLNRFEQEITQKESVKDYEVKMRRKDGTEMDCLVTSTVRKASDGSILGYQGIIRDITERKQAEEQIKASLKEKEVLLKEIHHRVKNNLQVISSLLSLQSGYIRDNKEAIEIFKESQNRVRSMALIHEKLYQSKDLSRINFADYIRSLVTTLFQSYTANSQAITPKIDVGDVLLDIDTAIPCGLIINELIANSLKHAFPAGKEGEIRIDIHSDNNKFTLIISDTGIGFPKDLDFRNTGSLGLELVVTLTNQLRGTIALHSNGGTEWKIIFPA